MKLCDSSVLVDIDRGGVDERVAKLDSEGRHAISTVTVTELRLGVNKRYADGDRQAPLEDLHRLFARFEIVDVNRAIAAKAADIVATLQRRGEPVHDLHDVYIGATAATEQLPILTANTSHFERMDDVTVVDWATF